MHRHIIANLILMPSLGGRRIFQVRIFGSLFGGILADKKGPKFVWILIGTTWSLFVILTAFAGDIESLIWRLGFSRICCCPILFGFAEGPTFSNINKTNANWATPRERGFAVSLGLLGTPLGALLTAPAAVFLLSITSWRTMFIILGVLGLIWVIIWNKMFTDMPEDHPKVTQEELAKIRSKEDLLPDEQLVGESDVEVKWYHFFKNPTLVFNAIGYFAFQYINFLLLTWTPKYLQDEFGFELSSLWYLGMIPWIGSCITVLLGGKISDYLRVKTGSLKSPVPDWYRILIAYRHLLLNDTKSGFNCRSNGFNVYRKRLQLIT